MAVNLRLYLDHQMTIVFGGELRIEIKPDTVNALMQ